MIVAPGLPPGHEAEPAPRGLTAAMVVAVGVAGISVLSQSLALLAMISPDTPSDAPGYAWRIVWIGISALLGVTAVATLRRSYRGLVHARLAAASFGGLCLLELVKLFDSVHTALTLGTALAAVSPHGSAINQANLAMHGLWALWWAIQLGTAYGALRLLQRPDVDGWVRAELTPPSSRPR